MWGWGIADVVVMGLRMEWCLQDAHSGMSLLAGSSNRAFC